MYEQVKKPTSSWSPTVQKKSSKFGPQPYKVQPKLSQAPKEMPAYTPLATDWITDNPILRSLEAASAPPQEESEGENSVQLSPESETIQRQGESAAQIPTFAPSTPPPTVQREEVGEEEVEEQREVGIQQKQQLQAPPHDGTIQRQTRPRSSASSATGVRFLRFLNTGTGIVGHRLGEVDVLAYRMNGVELQFQIDPSALSQYRNLRPVQWLGPDVVYAKRGSPLTSPWQTIRRASGNDWDNPESANVVRQGNIIAYYDSPGISLTGYMGTPTSRLHVIQNFTGWVVGDPISGGGVQRLCEVAAWYSVVSLVNPNFDDPNAPPAWHRFSGNSSGTGWRDTSTPPEL